jgi:hypothetical protein
MKTKFFISSLVAVLLLTGCKKFLDKQPISTLTEENYYQNTSQVETQVIGCYASLQDVYNFDYILAGLRTDEAYISESEGDINQIDGFIEYPTNSYVASYWQNSYFTIKQCNTVLKYLNNVTDAAKKNYFEGEAKFIRAHMYFNMVRLFGGVPLITSSVEYNDVTPRSDSATIYNQIVSDLQTAVQKLPATWDASQAARVTSYTAKAMLAKVYLTQQRWTDSKNLTWDLIQTPGQYKLLPSYNSIFGINNEMNAEIMYAVRYKANSNGLGETYTYNMDKLSGSVGFRAAADVRNNGATGNDSTRPFLAADTFRKNQTFLTGGDYGTSYYCGGKYQDPTAPKNDAGNDFIVLRFADVILMYAEAENEINGNTALTPADSLTTSSRLYQLNVIRKRANPLSATALRYTYNDTRINTKDKFRKKLKQERQAEFCEENQRWYDLVRWGDAVTVMNRHFSSRALANIIQPYQIRFPIPQKEIDVSNHIITQNPGYH